jgi:hypothetical protein
MEADIDQRPHRIEFACHSLLFCPGRCTPRLHFSNEDLLGRICCIGK